VIETPRPAHEVLIALTGEGIFGGAELRRWYPEMERGILVCTTEMNTKTEIDRYAATLNKLLNK